MNAQTYYPNSQQLTQRLQAVRIIKIPPTSTEDQLDYTSAAEAAWQSWENLCGYEPFLVGTADADTTWYFNGDGSGTVDLQGGFVRITSILLNGTSQTLNNDFRTMPQNAAQRSVPITYLMFQGGYYQPFPAWYGQKDAVAVTGLRGYCTTLKSLFYEGILAIAIDSLLGESEFSKFGGIKSWKIGTDERTYDQQAFDRLRAACAAKIADALRACRRPKIA
jgi:hypothetical protein